MTILEKGLLMHSNVKYKEMLEKLIDILKREQANEGTSSAITATDLLHKMIGMASDASLEDIKGRILDG